MFSKQRHNAMDAIHGRSHRGRKMFILGAVLGAATAVVCSQKKQLTSHSRASKGNSELDDPFTHVEPHSPGVDPLSPH